MRHARLVPAADSTGIATWLADVRPDDFGGPIDTLWIIRLA